MKKPLTIIILITFPVLAFGQPLKSYADSIRLNQLIKTIHADSIRRDYLSAINHLNQYRYLKDSVLNITKQQQVNQLQLQYQTAKKDLEITSREKNIGLLTGQNRLTNQNIRQAQAIQKITVAAVIAAALLLVISLLQYRLKIRANLQLGEQQNIINQKNEVLQSLVVQKDTLLDEKELLIKEIHHRVKNNLQVIISLLNTQSAYLNDPLAAAAIRQSQHRMQSISLIHQKLYQSESRALINMQEYTSELVQYLQQSFDTGSRITFKLNIDDIHLDVLRAVPLGLILNEAITNAIKYGFADDAEGYIKVGLTCTGGKGLKLSVSDNGRGLPPQFSVDLCESLGINLMKGMCRQINGSLDVKNENGVAVLIDFEMDVAAGRQLTDDISPFDDRLNKKQTSDYL